MTRRKTRVLPIALRTVNVDRVEDITPAMRRITLAGEELRGAVRDGVVVAPFESAGFDDHIKIVFSDVHPGTQTAGTVDWNPAALAAGRDYTVRRWDPAAGTVDVDVVIHETGLASDWVRTATPGATVTFAGPKSCGLMPEGCDWQLLFGDETALPAIARWLEDAPAGTRARIFIEVPDAGEIQTLRTDADAEITWLVRDSQTPAGHSTQLLEALTSFEFWPGEVFVWGAGESLTLIPIRRFLRTVRGLKRDQMDIVGYWRRVAESPAHKPADRTAAEPDAGQTQPGRTEAETAPGDQVGSAAAEPPSAVRVLHQLHDLSELAPPLILRAFVTLDLPQILTDTPADLPALAEVSGLDQQRLRRLLNAAASIGLVARTETGYRSTELGLALADEDIAGRLDLRTEHAAAEMSLFGLVGSIIDGSPAYPGQHNGAGFGQRLASEQSFAADVHRSAGEQTQLLADPISALPLLADAHRVTLFGDGIHTVAAELLADHPRLQVTAVALPAESDWLRQELAAHDPGHPDSRLQIIVHDADEVPQFPPADLTVLINRLPTFDDPAAQQLLSTVSAAGPALLIERTGDEAATDDHIAADDLLALTVHGGRLRTSEEIIQLCGMAGTSASQVPLGWGFTFTAFELTARIAGE